jgi:hypothetical protein
MIKYLTIVQLNQNLQLGKSVEQWLSADKRDNYTVLKWLRIDKEKSSTYSVCYFESFDEGNKDFVDIYEFSLLSPDDLGGVVNTVGSVEEALDFAVSNYAASRDRFVSAGIIQDEYSIYLNKR